MKRSKDHKKEEEELDLINRVIEMLKVNAFVKDGEWSAKDVDFLNKHLFLTSKPVIYLVNIGKEEYIKKQNAWLPKI
jgi:obg-like ATPase 1